MKSKKSWIGISILIVLLIFLGLNFQKIKFTVDILGLYKNKVSKKAEVENPMDPPRVLENPLAKLETNPLEKEDNKDLAEKSENKDKKPIEENIKTSKPQNPEKQSFSLITEKYNGELTRLQNNFLQELNSLITTGYEEYKSGAISNTQLANKYIDQGSSLESSCDKEVYAVIEKMRSDLKENGHDTSIINEVKQFYKDFKQVEKEKVFSKGFELME